MIPKITLKAALAASAILIAPMAGAAVLDFEGGIGYVAADDTAITTSTFNAYNISIDGDLSFESVGGGPAPVTNLDPTEGFVTDNSSPPREYDVDIDPNHDLHQFFLRQTQGFPANSGGTTDVFTINWLKSPTSTVSGEIWDIDAFQTNTEQWDVVANYAGGDTATEISPVGLTPATAGNLDGKAWVFSFDPTLNGNALESLDFKFTGNKQNIGVAFDNFETGVAPIPETGGAPIPLPAALPLLMAALGGLVMLRRCG